MHFFVKATLAPKLRSNNIFIAAMYLAGFFIIASVSQLFSFEDFPSVVGGFGLSIDQSFMPVIAALVVTLEVLAVPSLLQMKLSPAMRWLSRSSGWIVLLWWLGIGIWESSAEFTIQSSGLFGAAIGLPCGWWLVSYMVILLTLNGYVAWGTKRLHPKSKNKAVAKPTS